MNIPPSRKGIAHSEETKKRISESCKKRGIGKWMLGKKRSEESKRKGSKNSARYWLGKKRPRSKEWQEKIAITHRGVPRPDMIGKIANWTKGKTGKNHPCWIENKKSPLYKAIRQMYKYREWRFAIFTRDNFLCILCGMKGVYLEADHYPVRFIDLINKFHIKTLDEAAVCKELWNISNGRTLCTLCHRKTPTWGKRKN